MRRFRSVAAAVAALMVWAGPAHAGPPDRVEIDIFTIIPDERHGLAVFANIGRDAFCAWAADDFSGPAPVHALIPAMVKETGQGALVGSFQANVAVEMWQVDEDVPPFVDPCDDTDDQAGPWATGQMRWTANDNDIDLSLTRTNVFGDALRGSVVDVDGDTWRYVATFRAQIDRDDEFRVVVDHSTLTRTGQ